MTQQPKSKEKILSIADKSNPYTIPAFRSGFNEGFISGWEAYAEQHRRCGRWVKCSERLPEKSHNYHVKIQYEYIKDHPGIWNTASLWNGNYWEHPTKYETYSGQPEKANVVEWLDESPCECQQLREAAKELLHLHSCEQEGLQSGKPTPEMWFNAVNKLSEALSDAGNKEE